MGLNPARCIQAGTMTTPLDGSALNRVHQAIPAHVQQIAQVLERSGHRTWVVGGSLRDLLREIFGQVENPQRSDWDLATDATPQVVQRSFKRVIPTGIKHGTVTVLLGKQGYEVTTLRGEVGYSDGRRPDAVFFVEEIREDLARRDFTINAIAYDPLRHQLEDPFDGIGDLDRRLIKAVGDPLERFGEDGLRVLRAARFVAALEFELESNTARAIRPSLDSFRKVSPERVREEWVKAMASREPSRAFCIMRDHGLLAVTAPTLCDESGRREALDVALRAVDLCAPSLQVRLAALMHNLGSEVANAASPQGAASPLATDRAAELSYALLQSLRFSNKDRDRVVALVRHQTPPTTDALTSRGLRHWLRRIGPDLLPDLEQLMLAIQRARPAPAVHVDQVSTLMARARAELENAPPLQIRDLCLGGGDLMRQLGLRPGPGIGKLLEALLDMVIDDPSKNRPEPLLQAARELCRGGHFRNQE